MDLLIRLVVAVVLTLCAGVSGYLIGRRPHPTPSAQPAATPVQPNRTPQGPAPSVQPPRPPMRPNPSGSAPPAEFASDSVATIPTKARPAAGTNQKLVWALIGAHDTSNEVSVQAQIAQSLGGVGVTSLVPRPHSAFDPATQRCVETVPASGAAVAGQVAHTVRPGWRQADGTELRPADVAIWEAPE